MKAGAVAVAAATLLAACGTDSPSPTGAPAPSTATVAPATSGVADEVSDDCDAGRAILTTNEAARTAVQGSASLVVRSEASSLWLIGAGQAMVVDAAGEVEVMSLAAADPIFTEMTSSGSPPMLLQFSLRDDGTWACYEASTPVPRAPTSIGG